ncbi:MAG TPA: hypothetical protein VE175_15190 [Woeseiaceae bacterium]|nr:hypothetical protein [Woeseiaceae bacterium]
MSVALSSLWLPILLSAVVVFIASSLIWTVIQYHNSDWHKLPDEEAARHALKGVAPGEYTVPHAADSRARRSPEWQERYREGPAVMLSVLPHGSMAMGKQLVLWFSYCLIISLLVGYVAAAALGAGTEYLKVFQVTGTTSLLAYAGGAAAGAIWFGHSWSRAVKDVIDGLIYGLLTAGIFGWLWP